MKILILDRNRRFIDEFIAQQSIYVTDSTLEIETEHNDFKLSESPKRIKTYVSPANSFGFMNGGIDQIYLDVFGKGLETIVREKIKASKPFGELLVGDSLVVSYNDINLIVAPTMRVPAKIVDATDIYLATRSAVFTAKQFDIQEFILPGMGTGVGGVPFQLAAKNMCLGIMHAVYGYKEYETLAQAHLTSQYLKYE